MHQQRAMMTAYGTCGDAGVMDPAARPLGAGRAIYGLAALILLLAPIGARAAAPGFNRIYGGASTPACGWPTAVLVQLESALCSGTLVSPEIVVYAAHCGSDVRTIAFGDAIATAGPARTVTPTSCHLFPGHSPAAGTDFAYCRLPTPITDVPIVPILMGCELAALTANAPAVLVGFGRNDSGLYGNKHAVTVLQAPPTGNEAVAGGAGHSICLGDSGGPAFVQLAAPDSSWRVYGVASYFIADGGSCGSAAHLSILAHAVPWIEADSGLDISPCTDADGSWHPNGRCGQVPLHPDAGGGSWQNGCGGGAVTGMEASCGLAYAYRGPDFAITSPTLHAQLEVGAPLTITVHVTGSLTAGGALNVSYAGARLEEQSVSATGDHLFGPVEIVTGHQVLVAEASDSTGASRSLSLDLGTVQNGPGGCGGGPQPWLGPFLLALSWRRRAQRQVVRP